MRDMPRGLRLMTSQPRPLPDKDAWIKWVMARMRWVASAWPPVEAGPDAAKERKD